MAENLNIKDFKANEADIEKLTSEKQPLMLWILRIQSSVL
jgi:hypothetical protein